MKGSPGAAVLLACLLAQGCGYRLAGGGSGVLPPTVQVVAVTTFENRTARTEIEQRVTEEVAREFSRRGRYKVVTDPVGADALLEGAITDFRTNPVQFNAEGRATRVETVVMLRATLRGATRADVDALAREFVRDKIENDCFRDALATIRRHREARHHLVLMSASVDFYVPEFGRQLGFDQVISTEVKWIGDRLDGTLTSANRRGEEKARCVRQLLEEHGDVDSFAYGNSDSDLPHLRLVNHGQLVNGSLAARRHAAELGVSCVDWT